MQPVLVKPGLFRDRREAGRLLAEKLAAYANRPDVLVLALPRGGVPVAYEVARGLGALLDVFVVRKLGVARYEKRAMGAIATGGVRVLGDQLVDARATEMGQLGELNVGQLTREKYAGEAVLIGFTTHTAQSRRPPTGANPPSASVFARHRPVATRRCSMRCGTTGSCLSSTTAT